MNDKSSRDFIVGMDLLRAAIVGQTAVLQTNTQALLAAQQLAAGDPAGASVDDRFAQIKQAAYRPAGGIDGIVDPRPRAGGLAGADEAARRLLAVISQLTSPQHPAQLAAANVSANARLMAQPVRTRGTGKGGPRSRSRSELGALASILGKSRADQTNRRLRRAGQSAFRSLVGQGRKGDTARGSRGGGGSGGGLGKVLGGFAGKLLGMLAPMSLFAQILNSNASGFQLVGGAMKVLAATVGPILLPFFVVLATALIALSDVLWGKIQPGLRDFYQLVVDRLLPAVGGMIKAFEDVVEFLKSIVRASDDVIGERGTNAFLGAGGQAFLRDGPGTPEQQADRRRRVDEQVAGMSDEAVKADFTGTLRQQREEARARLAASPSAPGNGNQPGFAATLNTAMRMLGRGGPPAAGEPKDPTDVVRGALGDVLQELRQSMGPKASFSGLSQASKNAQLAALNTSPFEKKMLDRMDKAVKAMEEVSANTRQRVAGRYDTR